MSIMALLLVDYYETQGNAIYTVQCVDWWVSNIGFELGTVNVSLHWVVTNLVSCHSCISCGCSQFSCLTFTFLHISLLINVTQRKKNRTVDTSEIVCHFRGQQLFHSQMLLNTVCTSGLPQLHCLFTYYMMLMSFD